MPEQSASGAALKRFVIGALVIVAASATGTAIAAWHEVNKVVSAVTHTKHIPGIDNVISNADAGKPQTILLMGSDQRSKNSIDVRSGAIKGKPNSDTMMLMRLDPSKRATALLSLPRDLRVFIPGHGFGKLNAAYAIGGARLTVRTIDRLDPRIRINHVIDVDFHGFATAVNALGCIYVDVDRNYFNQSNLYSKINIHAGYQRLCGQDALSYVRYRHEDNDLVRATRQQDFLRDVKAQVGAFGIINDRNKLLHIFSAYTRSDLHSRSGVLRLLQLAILSATHPVQEIHFHARLGPSYVYAGPKTVDRVVAQFLGVPSAKAPKASAVPRRRHVHHHATRGLVDATAALRDQAQQVATRHAHVAPVWYPTRFVAGSSPLGPPSVYAITTRSGKRYSAYRIVIERPGPAFMTYYGVQGTTFTNAPLLAQAHSTRVIHGRRFLLYPDGPRLRLVAWRSGRNAYWISNTLLESISPRQMLAMAASTRHL